MYRAFASLSYSNLITSLCALLDAQDAATDTMRTSPALASVYMTSSLRPSSDRPVCTRLFGLRGRANRSRAADRSILPAVATPGLADEPPHHDDHVGEGDPEIYDPILPLGTPH